MRLAFVTGPAVRESLCETCQRVREVVTPKGSRFLLCRQSQVDPAYPKYPRQPVGRCAAYVRGAQELDEPPDAAGE